MRMGRDRAKRKTPPQDKNRSIVEPNRARGTESNSRAVNFSTDPGFLIIPDGHRTERDGQKAGVAFQGKQKRRRYPAKTHPPGSQSQHGTQPISGKNQFGHSAASGIPVKREGDKWKKMNKTTVPEFYICSDRDTQVSTTAVESSVCAQRSWQETLGALLWSPGALDE